MLDPIAIDYRVLAFNFSLSLLTGAAFGLAPAIQASRTPLNESLKDGSRGATESKARRRLRSLLAASELALAMVLLVGAGLLLRSFLRLREIDPGIRTDHVLSMTIDLTPSQYPTTHAQAAFFQQVLERTKALAGIQSAAVSSSIGLMGYRIFLTGGTIEGRQETFDVDNVIDLEDFSVTTGPRCATIAVVHATLAAPRQGSNFLASSMLLGLEIAEISFWRGLSDKGL
jgi:hypothetical protein